MANPPFSYRWEPREAAGEDMRYQGHGVAPKRAADFAFLLHGLHYLKDDGRVTLAEIEKNDFNLNISRYVSTAEQEAEIDLAATHRMLVEIEEAIRTSTSNHNRFLKELGLPLLPSSDPEQRA